MATGTLIKNKLKGKNRTDNSIVRSNKPGKNFGLSIQVNYNYNYKVHVTTNFHEIFRNTIFWSYFVA